MIEILTTTSINSRKLTNNLEDLLYIVIENIICIK